MLIELIKRLLPPYDKNGSVTPVTGINPITTERFKMVWIMIWNIKPKDKYLPNWFSQFKEILILR